MVGEQNDAPGTFSTAAYKELHPDASGWIQHRDTDEGLPSWHGDAQNLGTFPVPKATRLVADVETDGFPHQPKLGSGAR